MYLYSYVGFADCKRINAPQDVRHTLSSTPPEQLSKTCYKLAMSDLKLKTLEFQGRIFTVYPNKLRKRCVTSFSGALAINAHRVDQEDELDFPWHLYIYTRTITLFIWFWNKVWSKRTVLDITLALITKLLNCEDILHDKNILMKKKNSSYSYKIKTNSTQNPNT